MYDHNCMNTHTARDVLSICRVAESTKSGGTHTGQKGLGFKSVFGVTNRPVIISHNWSFCFDATRIGEEGVPKNKGGDNLAYVTPHWVDAAELDTITPLANLTKTPGMEAWSHLYLPLKSSLLHEGRISKQFEQLVEEPAFRYVLLHMSKISNITVNNRLGEHATRVVLKLAEAVASTPCDPDPSAFVEHRLRQVNLRCSRSTVGAASTAAATAEQEDVVSEAVRIHEFDVAIPESISRNEPTRASLKQTCIRLAFPLATDQPKTVDSGVPVPSSSFPPRPMGMQRSLSTSSVTSASNSIMESGVRKKCYVYATLPMCDAGLFFVLNADWVTTTNRANVVQASQYNQHLRDRAADLFVHAVLHDEAIKMQLGQILPRPQHMPNWWSTLGDTIIERINDSREDLFGAANRLHNPVLQSALCLSDSDLNRFANMQVLQEKDRLGLTSDALQKLDNLQVNVSLRNKKIILLTTLVNYFR